MTNKELIRKKTSYNFYAICYRMFLTLIIISNQFCFSYWELLNYELSIDITAKCLN
jgi:hypothetical protein